jgi:hypothetical protein
MLKIDEIEQYTPKFKKMKDHITQMLENDNLSTILTYIVLKQEKILKKLGE